MPLIPIIAILAVILLVGGLGLGFGIGSIVDDTLEVDKKETNGLMLISALLIGLWIYLR